MVARVVNPAHYRRGVVSARRATARMPAMVFPSMWRVSARTGLPTGWKISPAGVLRVPDLYFRALHPESIMQMQQNMRMQQSNYNLKNVGNKTSGSGNVYHIHGDLVKGNKIVGEKKERESEKEEKKGKKKRKTAEEIEQEMLDQREEYHIKRNFKINVIDKLENDFEGQINALRGLNWGISLAKAFKELRARGMITKFQESKFQSKTWTRFLSAIKLNFFPFNPFSAIPTSIISHRPFTIEELREAESQATELYARQKAKFDEFVMKNEKNLRKIYGKRFDAELEKISAMESNQSQDYDLQVGRMPGRKYFAYA